MLTSDNILLRAMEPSDVELLYTWENETRLWHLSNTTIPFSRFSLEQYVLSSHHDIFADKQLRLMIDIRESTDRKTVGVIDLFEFDPVNKRAGVGILVFTEERGKGYASSALEILIDYAFKTLHLHQLFANILKDNEESLALFGNKGFNPAGLKKDWILIDDNWYDEYTLQLLNEKK